MSLLMIVSFHLHFKESTICTKRHSNDKRYNSIIKKYQKDSNSVCLDEIQFLGDYYPKKLKNDSKFLKCCHVYYIWFLSLSLFKDFYAKTLNDVIFNFRWNVITASVSIIS